MAAFNSFLLFLIKSSALTLIVVDGASDYRTCNSGYFFDVTKGRCKNCTAQCPPNHIIIQDCSRFADLKCRLFVIKRFPHTDNSDFKIFKSNWSSNNNNLGKGERNFRGKGVRNDNNKSGRKPSSANNNNNELTSVDNEDDQYWKTLAFALIGLLSFLIITTFIILICVYKRLQKSIVIKQTDEGDLMDDADSGYVVIRAIHHMDTPRINHPILSLYPREMPPSSTADPSNNITTTTSVDSGRPTDSFSTSTQLPSSAEEQQCFLPKSYQPQRRLLNYDADDVFESDDTTTDNAGGSSGGNVLNHNHHCHHDRYRHRHLVPDKENLQALIDDNNDGNDNGNSGQGA